MKKSLSLLAAAALLVGFSSCTRDNDSVLGQEDDGDVRFLSVNILSAQSTTRADGSNSNGDTGTFEDGAGNENAIEKVRFYFFKSDDKAANVVSGNQCYYDWENPAFGTNTESPNVEKTLTATIVLSSIAGDETSGAQKMVAVINPGKVTGLPTAPTKLDDLRAIIDDWASLTSQDNGFVMYNSCYAINGTANSRVTWSDISSSNICQNQDLARQNPVNVYVERCVAKVRFSIADGVKNDNDLIELKNKVAEGDPTPCVDGNGNQIYLKVNGWDLTATTDKGYMAKHIYHSDWGMDNTTIFGTHYWNWADYKRSFWAANCADAGQKYISYNDITNTQSYLYTNENAANSDGLTGEAKPMAEREFPTQVIISGTLCDSEGNAIQLSEYGGEKYAGEEALRTAMANVMLLYKKVVTEEVDSEGQSTTITTYTKITADDIVLKTYMQDKNPVDPTQGINTTYYFVYPELTELAKTAAWSLSNEQGTEAATAEQISKTIDAAGHGRVWTDGATYYFFKIRHLGDAGKPGEYGVVRNHIYDCVVSGFYGLGTPVYDPDETIYPEVPTKDDDTYVAAKINVLSWRVVTNNVELDWTI